MPAITRLGDNCTGHTTCACPPRPSVTAASTVYANGKRIVNLGKMYAPHGCPKHSPPHPGNLASGSSTVFVEGLPVGRIGDQVSCDITCKVGIGSPNVFAN